MKKNEKWRLIYLLPMATGIYLGNKIKEKNKTVIGGLVVLVLILILILILSMPQFLKAGRAQEALEVPPSPSPSPVETPIPTPTPEPETVTLTFAGDCTLGTDVYLTYSTSFNAMYEAQGPEYFFSNVNSIFEEDDLTVVNFEGTLTDAQERADKSYAFKGDKEYVNALTAGSIEVCNLANNHTGDYGESGFSDTKATLQDAGLEHFGFEDTCIVDVNGVKVGFTGQFTVYEGPEHLELLEKNIKALQNAGAQIIVANFHWGLELDYYPDADQIQLAHSAIDLGAHLVIGHHPHVLQGVEVYKGRYICYSLGNFCFGGNASPPDYDAMIFRQTFTLHGNDVGVNDNVEVIPCLISSTTSYNNYCPTPAEGSEKERILEKLMGLSEDLGDKNIFKE